MVSGKAHILHTNVCNEIEKGHMGGFKTVICEGHDLYDRDLTGTTGVT